MAAAAHPVTPPPPFEPVPPPTVDAAADAAPAAAEEMAASRRGINPESVVARLPVELELSVPVRDFRVRNLLALEPGVVVGSQSSHGDDLPLSASGVHLAWTEFEVVDNTLAARITRIA